jgi:hypothetical protein
MYFTLFDFDIPLFGKTWQDFSPKLPGHDYRQPRFRCPGRVRECQAPASNEVLIWSFYEFLWVSMSFYEFLGLPLPLSWHVLACVWDPKVIIECPWNSSGLTRVKLLGFAKRQEPERHCFFVEMKSQQNFLWRASDIMYRCKISFWGRRQMPRQSVPQSDSWC